MQHRLIIYQKKSDMIHPEDKIDQEYNYGCAIIGKTAVVCILLIVIVMIIANKCEAQTKPVYISKTGKILLGVNITGITALKTGRYFISPYRSYIKDKSPDNIVKLRNIYGWTVTTITAGLTLKIIINDNKKKKYGHRNKE